MVAWTRGFEQFYVDLVLNPEIVAYMLDRFAAVHDIQANVPPENIMATWKPGRLMASMPDLEEVLSNESRRIAWCS